MLQYELCEFEALIWKKLGGPAAVKTHPNGVLWAFAGGDSILWNMNFRHIGTCPNYWRLHFLSLTLIIE